jgi:hypothetical protein
MQLYSTSIFAFPFLKYQDTPHKRGRQQKLLSIEFYFTNKNALIYHLILVIEKGTCGENVEKGICKNTLHCSCFFFVKHYKQGKPNYVEILEIF